MGGTRVPGYPGFPGTPGTPLHTRRFWIRRSWLWGTMAGLSRSCPLSARNCEVRIARTFPV
eukprot:1086490-Rhodomonas_salina.1